MKWVSSLFSLCMLPKVESSHWVGYNIESVFFYLFSLCKQRIYFAHSTASMKGKRMLKKLNLQAMTIITGASGDLYLGKRIICTTVNVSSKRRKSVNSASIPASNSELPLLSNYLSSLAPAMLIISLRNNWVFMYIIMVGGSALKTFPVLISESVTFAKAYIKESKTTKVRKPGTGNTIDSKVYVSDELPVYQQPSSFISHKCGQELRENT